MKQYFVKLTYDILRMEDLNSTDKIILASRLGWGKKPYFKKVATLAGVLNMPLKTVQKSITKLKRLGYWPNTNTPTREGSVPAGGGDTPARGGSLPSRGGDLPTRGGNKKSVSPMKTDVLLDSILDIKLDKNKITGLESAAAASALCNKPQTALKKLESKTTVTSESQEIKISGVTGSEAPIKIGIKITRPSVPLGPDGKPMTKADMTAANFIAIIDGKPEPFSVEQVKAGDDGNPWLAQSAAEFERVFGQRAG